MSMNVYQRALRDFQDYADDVSRSRYRTFGDLYVVTQEEYRFIFDAYVLFLKHIDMKLAHNNVLKP